MNMAGLVDSDGNEIDRRIFADQDVYDAEMANVFAKSWLFLCHESQIPNPGDFMTTYMGEDPVIVWRNMQGQIGAYLNVCRHRGNRLCRADLGTTSRLTCTYHGWAYDSDGRLAGVPLRNEAYFGELDISRYGLASVAQIDSYKGLYFATFNPDAPPLLEYLGGMAALLDICVDRREGGIEILPGTQKWIMPANWKVLCENSAGDGYHVAWTHRSALMTWTFDGQVRDVGWSGAGVRGGSVGGGGISAGLGHASGTVPLDASVDPPDPVITAYEDEIRAEVEARTGDALARVNPSVALFFPNFTVLRTQARTLRMYHPRGPDQTEVWVWVYVDKAAPAEVKDAFRRAASRTFGAAGTFLQDDVKNWQGSTETARGTIAKRYPLVTQAGLGHEHVDKSIDGIRSERPISETPQRAMYRRWAEMMADGPVGSEEKR
jgi:3-phenylpropionate/trans-cinnamate dioxygenase alpha subunit